MRILFFGDCAAEHLRRWSKYFANMGHDIHVITWNNYILDGYDPVQVHLLKKYKYRGSSFVGRLINFMILFKQVKSCIINIKPDIIHAHSAGAYSWIAAFIGFRPLVITPWGNDVLVNINSSRLVKLFTVYSLKKADLVHCDGSNTRDAIIKLGVLHEKIKILTFGVDIKKFYPGKSDIDFLQKNCLFGFNVIVSSRTLNPNHNVETVIRCAPLVLDKAPNTKFLIVGSGIEDKMLQDLSITLGVAHAVVFLGRVDEHQMVNCLRSAKIYVSTSLSESGLAASTAEAMACGLPVINTDTGDIRLWIDDNKGGFIVPTKDYKSISDKIIYLLEHEEMCHKFSMLNRLTIENRNNVYIEMKNMETIYKNVVERHKDQCSKKVINS